MPDPIDLTEAQQAFVDDLVDEARGGHYVTLTPTATAVAITTAAGLFLAPALPARGWEHLAQAALAAAIHGTEFGACIALAADAARVARHAYAATN